MTEYKQAQSYDRAEIQLNSDQIQTLNSWIDEKKTRIQYDRQLFISRHKKYLANFDDFITFTRKGPWENSSNLHMPLTSIVTRTYFSRLYNIFSSPDTSQWDPRESHDKDHVLMLRKLREWYLWDYINEFKGLRSFCQEVFWDTVSVGFGIGLKTWEQKQRKFLDIQELKREITDMEGMEPSAENKISVNQYKEVPKLLDVYEGSKVITVPFENIYFPNNIPFSSDLDHPQMVSIETEMTVSQMKLKGEQGVWDKDLVQKAIDEGQTNWSDTQAQNVKQQRAALSGYNETLSEYDKERRIIEYAFCTYDIDDDGIAEEIVVTRTPKGSFLKAIFLDTISRSGKRPLFKFDCFFKPRQAYSRGIPEYMYPLNEEMDMIHNMRLDYMALQACPFGSYRSSSSLKKEPIRISPGKFIPVDERGDLQVLNFQSSALQLVGEEDRLWSYAERQASTSSLQQGIVPNTVGPTRSTSGVITLLRQMDKEFKPIVDACADQWKKMEMMLMDDLDFRIDPEVKMRVLGASITDFLNKEDTEGYNATSKVLRVKEFLDVQIDVASLVNSEDVRRNEATLILDKLAAPSLLQQFGIVSPKTLYKAAVNWIESYGENAEEWFETPTFTTKPLSLYQEIQILAQGDMPQFSMQDDHTAKAQMLQAFMQSPEYTEAQSKGLYISNMNDMMMKAIAKHAALAESLAPKGMPNSTGEQGASQAELGSGTAPQQGGQSPNLTTSRQLNERQVPNSPQPQATLQ